MVNKVKVSVLEKNGEEFGFPVELDASEDYISMKGIAFEGNENAMIYSRDEELRFKDLHFLAKSFYDFMMTKMTTIEDFTVPEDYSFIRYNYFNVEHTITINGELILTS